MALADGSNYLQGASDEIVDNASAAVSKGAGLVIYCGCNKNQAVEFYCEEHGNAFCSPCKNMQHYKCTTCHIQEKSAGYTTEMFNLVMSKTESLKDKFEQLRQESSKSTMEASKAACKREIETFRRELDLFLNKLEHDLLEEMERHASDQQRELDQQASVLASAQNMLDSDYKLLETARQDGRKTTMFILDLQVSKRLQDYKNRLTDLQKELLKPDLSFEKNRKLADIQTEIKELGYLNEKDSTVVYDRREILLTSQVIDMAFTDSSNYLQGASDEMVDNVCGPCKQDKIEKGANFYCTDCGVYLCTECKVYHRKLPVTENHKIVTGSEVQTSAAANQGAGFAIYCGCNKNQEFQFYCEEHDDVFCRPCKDMQHHKCTTCQIQEKSVGYTTEMFNLVMSKTESLKDKYEQLRQESSKSTMKASKNACKREIKTFRRELEQFLNKLEHELLEEMENDASDQQRKIDQQASILADARNMLDSDYRLLDSAKQDGRKTIMFISDLQVSKRLQDYKNRLTDLQKELPKSHLSFQRNTKLADIQSQIKQLGYLNNGSFLGKRILMASDVKVKLSEDKHVPWISGCSVLLTGELVLCDKENNKIKLLDTSGVQQDSLKLSSMPWDVSVIDANNVIVSLPDKKRLQYIQVLPQLKAGHTVQVDKKCFGVEVSGGEIYTTCHNNPGKGEIRVLDLDGNRKRRLGVLPDGSFMFKVPQYITISAPGRKMFVSDADTSAVTCMTGDGSIVYRYKDDDLKCPLGLSADGEDNIVVCDAQSNKIQVVASDGRKHSTLLSSINHDVISLYSITYKKRDNTLVIGCYNADTLLLFELS